MPSEAVAGLVVYGLRNCDGCRRALKWLEARAVPHRFHDLRADGLPREQLRRWLASPLAAQLVNRRSTTWRQLGPEQRQAVDDAPFELLLEHPTLIKRPVVTADGAVVCVGYSEACLEQVC